MEDKQRLGVCIRTFRKEAGASPWLFWLDYRCKTNGELQSTGARENYLCNIIKNRNAVKELWLAAVIQGCLLHEVSPVKFMASLVESSDIIKYIKLVITSKRTQNITSKEDYQTYVLLSSFIEKKHGNNTILEFNYHQTAKVAYQLLGYGPSPNIEKIPHTKTASAITGQLVYQHLSWGEKKLDSLRPFFNSDVRSMLRAVEVTHLPQKRNSRKK